MATFTITASQNIDELVGKTGGDIYNINGGTLTIDQDSRVGQNQTTSTSLGNITLSGTLGGNINIDSRFVRLIPYTAGTGTVPAWNTVISIGGASGKLIGVYSALNVASTATGGVMPVTGFIKIKQWNSVAYTAGALTGISATASGVDTAGWLELVGDELGSFTYNRLNNVNFTGDYFDLGVTTGSRASTYQIPSSGMIQYHGAVEVETAVGSGVYEGYPFAGTQTALLANIATDSLRGKYCWINTAGVLRFGNDGTNSTGGFIPPAGLKIRIPNIFLHNCTTAARTANVLPNATLASRYEFVANGGGVMSVDKCSASWYFNINQPFSFSISNTSICDSMIVAESGSNLTMNNVNIGPSAGTTFIPIYINTCLSGGTISNCKFITRTQALSNNYCSIFNDLDGFTFNNNFFGSLVKSAHLTTGSIAATRVNNSTFNNTTLGGGRFAEITCDNLFITNTIYYDHPATNTGATIPMYAFDLSTKCSNIIIDGLSFGGLFMTQPYNGILNIGIAGCSNIKLRNIGTYASPLSLGSPRVDDQAWTRVTTTATVTSVNHGFIVGDNVYVVVSSDVAAITVVLKTITAVPTASTFSFVCLNAGATSGTLSYFGVKCGLLYAIVGSAVADGLKVQRVYTPHTRTNLYTVDNSSKNISMENVFSDYLNAPLIDMLNGFSKGVSGTPPLFAQSSIYGTHWFDGFVVDVADNTILQSYSRTTTVCTITSVGHSLRTGMLIHISNPDVAPTTFTATSYVVTVLTSSTFTITVANAGAVSGTISYRVANGRIGLSMNEASNQTVDVYTINAGTPKFTSTGGLFMPTIGDQITFETPNYIIGQGSTFPVFEPVMGTSTLTRYTILYAIDKNDGNGFSAFKNLYYERAGSSGISGQFTYTVTDSTGVAIGDYVWGTGISPMAKVTDIVGNTITVDRANIATVSGITRYNQLPAETGISPALGVKFRWRITTAVTNTVLISSLYIQAESTTVGRANQYPLETTNATYSLTGLVSGSEIVVFNSSNVELKREVIAGTTFNYNYIWNSDDGDTAGNYILVWKDDKKIIKLEGITFTQNNVSIPLKQDDDLVYNAVYDDRYSVDYTTKVIGMDSGQTVYDVQGAYSYAKDNYLLTNNAQYEFPYTIVGGDDIISGFSAVPYYTKLVSTRKIQPQSANHTLSVVNGILLSTVADPFLNSVGFTVRINYQQPVQAIAVDTSGGGGGGGDTKEDIYTYFTTDDRQDTFKADVTLLATISNQNIINENVKLASLVIPASQDTA